MDDSSRIVVAGAGSIGCFIGGWLALAGRNVRLLLRPRMAEHLSQRGLRLSDLYGRDRIVTPDLFEFTTDATEAFRDAAVILVTVKSGATEEMARLITRDAPEAAIVLSLQNGVDNVPLLRSVLAKRRVLAGMVPFNVAQSWRPGENARFHRSTSGAVTIEAGHEDLRRLLDVEGLPCRVHPDMDALAWSKLVLNLNNALNAVSGLPLREELSRRAWRLLLADQMTEALVVARQTGIRLPRIEGVSPAIIPYLLRLPDFLFGVVAHRMLAIDPQATSSMAEDLAAGRKTEVDYLQGAVVRLAAAKGLRAPICRAMVDVVRECESDQRRRAPEEIAQLFAQAKGGT